MNSKRNKKNGKKDEVENANQALEWKHLSKSLLKKIIIERTSQEDWNAGVIINNLSSPFWNVDKIIVDVIIDAHPEENICLIAVTLPKDKDGLEYCDNYKYKMRKETDEKPAEKMH